MQDYFVSDGYRSFGIIIDRAVPAFVTLTRLEGDFIVRKYYSIQNGRVLETEDTTAPIQVFANPTDEEKKFLVEKLLLDEHTLQSALDLDEISRLEFEPSHTAIILKRPMNYSREHNFQFKVASIGAFLFKDKLILVQTDDMPLFFGGKPMVGCQSLPGALLYLMYHTISHFLGHLRVIRMVSDELEQKIQKSIGTRALSNMFALEKSLVYYRSALHSNETLLSKLRMFSEKIGFSPLENEFLEDISVENGQCYKLVEIYSDIMTSMSDARVSIVSNNLAILMKKLTIISVVFMPLNIVASMFGMSEWTQFTNTLSWPVSYLLFTSALVLLGYLTYLVISKVGLTDKEDD